MTGNGTPNTVHARHHQLRKLFIDHSDARRVLHAIETVTGEYLAAQDDEGRFEARGVAVLGPSGAGKSHSVEHALSELGMPETEPGDCPRPFLIVQLSAKATLRAVFSDTLAGYGWDAPPRDSAQTIWRKIEGYIKQLDTFILVLDEIQHVRSTGREDREALTSFLKSLVLPRPRAIIPIVIGMPSFAEVLNSDDQLRRRFTQVNMRKLDPAVDLETAIRTLNKYAKSAQFKLADDVTVRDFAARLLHASRYSFGELCVSCRMAAKVAMAAGHQELCLEHFQQAYLLNNDCLPELNPFIAEDFENT